MTKKHMLFWPVFAILLASCGFGADYWAGVTVSEDDEIYVSYQKFIAKVNVEGEQIWTYPSSDNRGPDFYANPTITEDVVYIGDYEGGVHAIDRETGDEIWAFKQSGTRLFGFATFGGATDRVIGGVAVGDDVIYVPDEDGIFLLDRETGERLDTWTLETERAVWSTPLFLPEQERLYVTSLDHRLYAIDTRSYETLWEIDLEAALPGSPSYDAEQNLLFVGSFGSEVSAIDAESGEILAQYESNGWVWEAPTLQGNNVYFADLDGYIYGLTYEDGRFTEKWDPRQLTEEGRIRAAPVVAGNLLIVGADNDRIYAVERETGNQEWDRNLESRVISNLFVIEGEETIVVTATNDKDKLVVGLFAENGDDSGLSYEHEG